MTSSMPLAVNMLTPHQLTTGQLIRCYNYIAPSALRVFGVVGDVVLR